MNLPRSLLQQLKNFLLVTQMTFRSIFNRYYLLRLLPVFGFLFIMAFLLSPGTCKSLDDLIFGFIRWGTWDSFMTMFISIALAGLVFSSSRNRTMIATLQSHPISRSAVFFARYLLLAFLVFLAQLFVFFWVLCYFAFAPIDFSLWMALSIDPGYIGGSFLVSLVASAIVGIWTASLYSFSSILFKKSQIGYVLNFILFIGYESIVANTRSFPFNDYYIYGVIATIRNLIVHLIGLFRSITATGVQYYLGIALTLDDLVVQLQFFALFVLVGTILAWLVFCVRSRTW